MSVSMPSPQAALDAQARCRADGVLVGCFRPPSTPDGSSRLRITASARHSDADEINRMLGTNVAEEWQRLALPLAPETIAHETGAALTPVADLVERLRTIEADVVIVEGAGGVMVGLDTAGGTIADLAQLWDAEVVVVTRDTLGTLNHTGLTVEHLRGRGLEPVLMVGADTGNQRNHRDMVRLSGAPLVGSVPRGNPESAVIEADWLNR
jgi:dethiobiotin synthase